MKEGTVIIIVAALAVVILIAGFAAQRLDGKILPGVPDDEVEGDSEMSLEALYENNFPDFIAVVSANCEAAGGDWITGQDTIGCYDIPLWDTAQCDTAEVRALKLVCNLAGGDYTCDDDEASCER